MKEPQGTRIYIAGGMFQYMEGHKRKYPAWRYHEFFPPKIVKDETDDRAAALEGWKEPLERVTALPHLVNWNYDLEDMNADQLRLFALEEYGVRFPKEANEEMLIKAIWHLARATPDKGRMVLLAQSVEMNYDETIKEIKKMAEGQELTSYEFEA